MCCYKFCQFFISAFNGHYCQFRWEFRSFFCADYTNDLELWPKNFTSPKQRNDKETKCTHLFLKMSLNCMTCLPSAMWKAETNLLSSWFLFVGLNRLDDFDLWAKEKGKRFLLWADFKNIRLMCINMFVFWRANCVSLGPN